MIPLKYLAPAWGLLTLVSFSANAIKITGGEKYDLEVYGILAISSYFSAAQEKASDYTFDNESYIGFRGNKDLNDNINVIFQIESGYVGYEGKQSGLGTFDTFIGLRGDWGTVRAGRMKTPMYEIVDWPYTNPGLGRVFDWGGDVPYHYSHRLSNTLRYDSPDWQPGNFALSVSRGDTRQSGSTILSGRVTVNLPAAIKLHLGAEQTRNRIIDESQTFAFATADTLGYIAGLDVTFPSSTRFYGAFKSGYSRHNQTGLKSSQRSWSLIVEHWYKNWGAKLGYAANTDALLDGLKMPDTADSVVALQIMTLIDDTFLPYMRVGYTDAYNADKSDPFLRLGIEFSF